MAYLDIPSRPSGASLAAVIAVHGAVGAALIFGLTVSGVVPTRDRLAMFTDPLPPPPPPTPQPSVTQSAAPAADPYVPPRSIPLPTHGPTVDTSEVFPLPRPTIQPGLDHALKPSIPEPTPSFAPVAATPRNDPALWVGTADYRSSWIRQEMTGTARFRLDIAADGQVTNCVITGSSGHPALDAATCALVGKRARFQPARGGEGEPVAGSYSNAIEWRLPE